MAVSKNAVKFGFLKDDSIQSKIEAGIVDAYDFVVGKDTNKLYFVDNDLNLREVAHDVKTYATEEEAITDINASSTTRAGQIISVDEDGHYRPYVVNEDTTIPGHFVIAPIGGASDIPTASSDDISDLFD